MVVSPVDARMHRRLSDLWHDMPPVERDVSGSSGQGNGRRSWLAHATSSAFMYEKSLLGGTRAGASSVVVTERYVALDDASVWRE